MLYVHENLIRILKWPYVNARQYWDASPWIRGKRPKPGIRVSRALVLPLLSWLWCHRKSLSEYLLYTARVYFAGISDESFSSSWDNLSSSESIKIKPLTHSGRGRCLVIAHSFNEFAALRAFGSSFVYSSLPRAWQSPAYNILCLVCILLATCMAVACWQ